MKIIKIRGCIECRHHMTHTFNESFCHNPDVMTSSFGWKLLDMSVMFPEWCPLEDVKEEKC